MLVKLAKLVNGVKFFLFSFFFIIIIVIIIFVSLY